MNFVTAVKGRSVPYFFGGKPLKNKHFKTADCFFAKLFRCFYKLCFKRSINRIENRFTACYNLVGNRAGVGIRIHSHRCTLHNQAEIAFYLVKSANGGFCPRQLFCFCGKRFCLFFISHGKSEPCAFFRTGVSNNPRNAAGAYNKHLVIFCYIYIMLCKRTQKAFCVRGASKGFFTLNLNRIYTSERRSRA